ncbi:MAG: MFS transporter [Rhodospirillales bacterium]|nr:MFS transporter [Rhodospirillales bacterium]
MSVSASSSPPSPEPKSFAALRHPGARAYLIGSALVMMADAIEHVISYWMIFEKFHSPALGGFAVVSHWLPFLLFSVAAGALADRFDPRRIIQIGMALFMLASAAWGVLFFTDRLEMWHAVVILVVHGIAGVFWGPAGQILLHDIVGPKQLHSAVRMLATSRTLGLLAGPAIGGVAMLALGPATAVLLNMFIYLPLALWLWKAPYGPKFRDTPPPPRTAIRGFGDILNAMRVVASSKILLSLTLLAGLGSLFVGNAYQAQMPEFAAGLSAGLNAAETSIRYNILFAAGAAGALTAGLVLEVRSALQPGLKAAFILAALWCVAIGGFAVVGTFAVGVALLFSAGFLYLAFGSMAQAMVQLNAPPEIRGRVLGLYSMSSLGLMTFSGMTVGFGGSLIGIHWSLGLSAVAMLAAILVLAFVVARMKPVSKTAR